jgi:hypothetical protein
MHLWSPESNRYLEVESNTGFQMTELATAFLASLDPEGEARVLFPLESEERMNWDYRPRRRQGMPLSDMDGSQRKLALALMAGGLSPRGNRQALTIMGLEKILGELEGDTNGRRDPDRYHLTIFGTPSEGEPWGWRMEGHHLSLNFLVAPGGRIAPTPNFFGANPARIPQGPQSGFRTLPLEENLGRELLVSLGDTLRSKAVIHPDAPPDIVTRWERRIKLDVPVGLPFSDMKEKQQNQLTALIHRYTGRTPPDVADERLDAIEKAGWDHIHFAWAGYEEPGRPHYYRIHGPSFLVEYDNTQNNANHIHTVWRDKENDWGQDLLDAHYRRDHGA